MELLGVYEPPPSNEDDGCVPLPSTEDDGCTPPPSNEADGYAPLPSNEDDAPPDEYELLPPYEEDILP